MSAYLSSIGYERWVLPALLLIPLVGALLISLGSLFGRRRETGVAVEEGVVVADQWKEGGVARVVSLLTFLVLFAVALGLWWSYSPEASTATATHALFDRGWIPDWGIRFTLGVDGIAVMMILLTVFLMPLTVLGSWTSIRSRPAPYYALLLVLTTGMLGVFMARDLFLFYVMWEMMLVPMYFIIGIWGGERRIYASIKFFLYTFIGSLLMLVAIVWLGIRGDGAPNFSYDAVMSVARMGMSLKASLLLFGAFALAFAVKVPMFPFHTWLPDAHVEAPTAGSVILAGVMLKMGTYGFLRFALPLFPDAAMHPVVRNLMLGLAVVGIIYGALVALVQPDFKKLVAYSSVSHLGFVMLGIFALTVQSVQGALMVMINHGISTGALFFLIGIIYERRHTREIAAYGGIARVVPLFSALLVLVSLSSIGLPGLNGFIGEFLVLIGSFRTHPILTVIATTGVIFAAAYLLWAIQRILFNALDKPENRHIPDLNGRELLMMAPLVIAIIWLGVNPQPVLDRMERSAEHFVSTVQAGGNTRVSLRGGR
jgi:NADH-quinone oxidoreductase subunit M